MEEMSGNPTNSKSRFSDIELLHRKIYEKHFFANCTVFKAEE